MDGVEVGTSANGHATTNGETNGVNGAAECSSSRVLLEQTLSETKARRGAFP